MATTSQSTVASVIASGLEKIIKNASKRKHSKLVQECKTLIDKFAAGSIPNQNPEQSQNEDGQTAPKDGPLADGVIAYSLAESEEVLGPFVSACNSGNPRVAEAAVSCVQKLIAHGHIKGEADTNGGPECEILSKIIESVCKCHELGDENLELLVLKTLLSGVTSVTLRIHGDCLLQAVRTCYNVFLASKNLVNQTTAKASLTQMLVIVFRRMEADSSTVPVQPIVVADLMEPAEKWAPENTQFVQNFITKVIQDLDVVLNPVPSVKSIGGHDGAFESSVVENANPADLLDSTDKDMLDAKYWEISMYKSALEDRKGELVEGELDREGDIEVKISNKLRRDAFLVFRSMCKLSMKTLPQDVASDPVAMRGKVLALELLKILLENAGSIFRTSERFLGAIKQYLCLSLLKNSASPHLNIFQLSCSIFMSLVSRFRAGLKAEIGVFFPMIVLRVLENVNQPNYQQKMIVLCFLEKLCVDSQILVDIFINYDCDVNSSNIFERMVNGLLKTAQGVPPGAATTLLPTQDATFKLEALKCLVAVLKSMGDWMNKQLRISESHYLKNGEVDEASTEPISVLPAINDGVEESTDGADIQPEPGSETTDVATFEQRRAYKLELQEGISLFNRKPQKGIDFLINAKKVGDSPQEIAFFLKNASGLDKTLIGDYLGERSELALKVMHAYVDSFNFEGMQFDEALRTFLQGFRLPGEAQKIDRITEKFAERYCKCNPTAFSSADTAYVLAYSVIMLNTDAHNPTVKNKMSKADFIRNNRGINDGKDLPEEYLGSLYDRIVKNEIKMKDDILIPQNKQPTNSNKILGLDSILNIVIRKRDGKDLETSDDLIRHMQEQFKAKASKSESTYYAASDVVILKFMVEVCWAPMLAAFSVPLDQSEDEIIIHHCLEGFRYAIHVTSVMCMQTHRDAFVTSLAKFTSLHSAADIKQKNIDAIKAIIMIADEDGNYLQEAWEHILTCVSRFEHLHLLGEGAPPDATFFAIPQNESDKSKQQKSPVLPVLKRKGPGRLQYAAAAARRGSYDSAGVGGQAAGAVTTEQMNNLVTNLNMLEQVGSSEMSRIFTRSPRLNSEAIVDFVKALCKVSMEELRSPTDPRVFSLTKIVEIAHYNMNRIRLIWSRIWSVLSDFFVEIGCSSNLSIAIFAMDSLRQLAMKFLEREELVNYNFQNEFMKPFVIVMRKSSSVEIRELIIRCVSQMVFARVGNVKSGWKIMFMVFTVAAADDHKSIALLAFETIERIVRDYFPYITETETTTFTDCVNCLVAFTNSRFNKDISLNAISFLSFCAQKLAQGELGSSSKNKEKHGILLGKDEKIQNMPFVDKDDHLYFWFPLLAGLSELSFDPRPEIRQSSLQVLFDTLRNHGHLFSPALWERVYVSVLFPLFDYVRGAIDPVGQSTLGDGSLDNSEENAWLYETCTMALQLAVDLFVKFYSSVNHILKKVLALLIGFIKRPHESLAGIGIAALSHLMNNAGTLFSEEKWQEVVLSLREAASDTLPDFSKILDAMDDIDLTSLTVEHSMKASDGISADASNEEMESQRINRLQMAIDDAKSRTSVQQSLIQAIMGIYNDHKSSLSEANCLIIVETLHSMAVHARKVNTNSTLHSRVQELNAQLQMTDPPLLRLESEAYQACLTVLQNLILDKPTLSKADDVEAQLVKLCEEVLLAYLETAASGMRPRTNGLQSEMAWNIPLGSTKRRELASRAPLVVTTLQAICTLKDSSFQRSLSRFFPLLTGLISCEHGSGEVQLALSNMLRSWVGPILLQA
eukprot:TRINITY_DN10944_c0_g1_i1.p1 TRINITY_DN10944_c0_g1~~TRINITY_DN10944_c0_g1_i1.p1  ORF type:complete len:1770 (+),score=306.81 TRINITY_DN10944_c0_g1_i1:196-5505(+)